MHPARWTTLFIAALVASAAVACDQIEEATREEPSDAAAEFVEAWNQADFEAMAGRFDAGTTLDASRLEALTDRLAEDGAIEDVEVALAGAPVTEEGTDEGPTAVTAPYTVTYTSEAARKPVALEGELELEFSEESESWTVTFGRENLLPGLDKARTFGVAFEW